MLDSNDQELRDYIEAFYFGYRVFTGQPDQILARRGLNRVHHRILYFVGQNPGIGVGGLLGILQVSKQALNAPLRQLVEMRLVHSAPAAFDRRVKQLRLTPSGVKLEDQLTEVQVRLLRDAIEQCPKESQQGWLSLMHALAKTERPK